MTSWSWITNDAITAKSQELYGAFRFTLTCATSDLPATAKGLVELRLTEGI